MQLPLGGIARTWPMLTAVGPVIDRSDYTVRMFSMKYGGQHNATVFKVCTYYGWNRTFGVNVGLAGYAVHATQC